ncbi:MAG: dihydrofolate reductase family protein [Acidimicrobiales bacterium]
MPSVRIQCIGVSLDGFASGEGQNIDAPFGHAGGRLLAWFTATQGFRQLQGMEGGVTNADDPFATLWMHRVGAEIMGRNMFGPQRGPWEDLTWEGWWDENPPYHHPVYVLTHHPRPSIEMEGGTTFHFLDASPAEALAVAQEAAGDLDVRISGGPHTIRQFLAADLVDYLHVVIVPIVLGRGEPLWEGLEGLEDRFDLEAVSTPSGVTHLVGNRRR